MANIKSFLFLLSSFLVAILLIVEGPKWAERIGQKYDKQVVPQSKVAQVVTLEGSASRRRYGEDAFEGLVLGHWLHNLDTVQLQTRAKMHLTIGDYKLALQGPGLLIFELWQNEDPTGPLVLHLISGELYVLEDGKAGKLYVVRNGEMLDPKGASQVRERRLLLTPLTISGSGGISVPSSLPLSPKSGPQDSDLTTQGLSNEYLDGEIAKQAAQFQRCQSNALRELGEVKGQMLVGLTILPEGKASQIRVLSSTLRDEKLHSCVVQVFQRLKFKSFNGAPIVRSYPLNFE